MASVLANFVLSRFIATTSAPSAISSVPSAPTPPAISPSIVAANVTRMDRIKSGVIRLAAFLPGFDNPAQIAAATVADGGDDASAGVGGLRTADRPGRADLLLPGPWTFLCSRYMIALVLVVRFFETVE